MTFAELKNKIKVYANRDDIEPLISDWVNIAIRKCERENWRAMERRATVTSTDQYISLPERYKEAIFLKVYDSGRYWDMRRTTVSQAFFNNPSDSETGRPNLFTVIGVNRTSPVVQNEILVRPTPDKSYKYDLYFYQYSEELVNDSDYNYWTVNAWEIVLYGALIEASPYLIDDPRLPVWQNLYADAMQRLRIAESYEKISGSTQYIGAGQEIQQVVGSELR